MKKWLFLSLVVGLMPLSVLAQDDDMYFASSKSKTTQPKSHYESTYYSGSSRSVDDYNRRNNACESLPVDTGDIISFAPVEGVYPDSVSDFAITKSMARWDDYVPETAYWEGYAQGRRDTWGWHSPWYYSAYYPWYDPWYYDPWYYSSWHYGWYDPWYYDYTWGWHYPYYHYGWYGGWGGYYRPYYSHHGGSYYGNTGSLRRNYNLDRTSSYNRNRVGNYTSSSRFDGARNRAASGNSGRSISSGNTSRSITRTPASRGSSSSGSTYGSSGSTYGSSRSSSGSSRSSSGSSYGSSSGSSRSGGGSFGGSRSGGGSSSGRSGGGGGGGRSGGGRR